MEGARTEETGGRLAGDEVGKGAQTNTSKARSPWYGLWTTIRELTAK